MSVSVFSCAASLLHTFFYQLMCFKCIALEDAAPSAPPLPSSVHVPENVSIFWVYVLVMRATEHVQSMCFPVWPTDFTL